MSELAGRVVIVTGASRGIGRRIALDLGQAGASVVVAAKTVRPHPTLPGTIDETACEVREAGGRALAVRVNVRDDESLERLVDSTLEEFGRIDALVNNAGALWWKPVLDTPARRFDLVMEVNVRAAFLLSRRVARTMIDRGAGGHIVMMSPPLDLEPHPGMVAYTISKLGMTMTAMGLADELRGAGVSVCSLWPATMIESLATVNWKLGTPAEWRKPEILSDATLALLRKDPGDFTGRQLIDEDFLREEGVTDFAGYRCVPDAEPPRVGYSDIPLLVERARGGPAGSGD
jgi:citronellol/citronellal dehydrogenase